MPQKIGFFSLLDDVDFLVGVVVVAVGHSFAVVVKVLRRIKENMVYVQERTRSSLPRDV